MANQTHFATGFATYLVRCSVMGIPVGFTPEGNEDDAQQNCVAFACLVVGAQSMPEAIAEAQKALLGQHYSAAGYTKTPAPRFKPTTVYPLDCVQVRWISQLANITSGLPLTNFVVIHMSQNLLNQGTQGPVLSCGC